MKKILFISLALFFIRCGSSGMSTTNPPAATTTTITIPTSAAGLGAAAYGTNPLHIAIGAKVVWKNSDSMVHTATSDTSEFDSGDISGGSTSSAVTFSTAGTYPYHCTIHGSASMSGVIMVP